MVGFPERTDDVYNALAVLAGGGVHADLPQDAAVELRRRRRAALLPGRRRGDRARLRRRAARADDLRGPLGARRAGRPTRRSRGALMLVNASASPYDAGKGLERERMLIQRARDNLCAIAFCNCVGGQDELVFDGHSRRGRPRGDRAGARAAVRGGADALHGRPAGGRHRAPARHAAAPAGPRRRCRTCAGSEPLERAPVRARSAGRRRRAAARARGRGLRRALRRRARLRGEERLRARRARAVGRDRLDARRADRGRRARRRPRDRGRDAVALLLRGHAERRARAGGEPRRRVPRPADRAGDGGLRADARAASSTAASPTSPRRTCRRGSAATC